MGMVLGKTGVAEPVYESLFLRSAAAKTPFSTNYEIRKYGTRFAIETDYSRDNTGNAFRSLAGYIGVGGAPQNEGSASISMTAPVATSQSASPATASVKIAMTAPVVTSSSNNWDDSKRVMQFYLPAEYDSISKIPKPLNPKVQVHEIPPVVGVAHTFSGRADEKKTESKVALLVKQLNDDGIFIQEEDAMKNYSLWQFNPPFTIPSLRRNEIWIPLTQKEVDEHLKRFAKDQDC
jgi:hypothetical protein